MTQQVEKLSETNKSLAQKIKKLLSDLLAKVKEIYSRLSADSKESKIVSQMSDTLSDIMDKWSQGIINASKNADTVTGKSQTKNTATKDGVKNSIRLTNSNLNEYLNAGGRKNKNKLEAISNKKKIILTSEQEIVDYINSSIDKKTEGLTVAYGKVNDRLLNDVDNFSDGEIDIKDYFLEIVPYDMQHAYEEHHNAKEDGDIDLTREDFEKIPEYLDTYDELLYVIKYSSGYTRICVSKKLPNGRMLIIETVSKSRGSLQFKNAIGVTEEKYQNEYVLKYKKRNSKNTRGNKSSNNSLRDLSASNKSIPQDDTSVNNQSMQNNKKNSDRDTAYLEAVKNGDIQTAQRMVDEAAKKAGYTTKTYHGTESFGFTKFDLSKRFKTKAVFMTDNVEVASTYSGIGGTRKISEAFKDSLDGMSTAELVKELNKKEYITGNTKYYKYYKFNDELIVKDLYDGVLLTLINIEQAKQDLIRKKSVGNYTLYVKLGNSLVVDCKGAECDEVVRWNKESPQLIGTTDEVAKHAKEQGYDSVILKNLIDNGGRKGIGMGKTSTVYIVFDPLRIKSADPVTYDDNGNVIPLSQRFNEDEQDIRYSSRIIDQIDPNDYNNIKISKSAYSRLRREAMTWNANKTNRILNTVLDEKSYYYILSDTYELKVIAVENAENIHERGDKFDGYKQNGRQIDRIVSSTRYRQGNSNNNRLSFENGREYAEDDRYGNRQVRGQRQSDGRRNHQNDDVYNRQGEIESEIKYQPRPSIDDFLFDDEYSELTDNDAYLIGQYITGDALTVNHLINNTRKTELSDSALNHIVSKLVKSYNLDSSNNKDISIALLSYIFYIY